MMQCSKVSVSFVPSTSSMSSVRASRNGGHALEVLDLAQVADLAGAGGSVPTTLFLKSRSLSRSIFGFCELDAEVFRVRRLVDDVGDVEQRLGRDAAAIDADAAGVLLRIDEGDLHPAVGGVERRRVAAGTRADDDELCESAYVNSQLQSPESRRTS